MQVPTLSSHRPQPLHIPNKEMLHVGDPRAKQHESYPPALLLHNGCRDIRFVKLQEFALRRALARFHVADLSLVRNRGYGEWPIWGCHPSNHVTIM
jgi:hypothetical protein